jgi:hypothetical protein
MSHRSHHVAAKVARFAGGRLDPRYLGFFDSFNRQQFHEAHDILEDLWLENRRGASARFFRALIQLAGSFVLLQKGRVRPAGRLLNRAEYWLKDYPDIHESADLHGVRILIAAWRSAIDGAVDAENPLTTRPPPILAVPD